jgi:putative FmdB family regulatory protein
MPLFLYACKQCGASSEVLIRSDKEQPVCPECGSKEMEKQLSRFAPVASSGGPADLPCATGACGLPPSGGCPGGTCPF